MREFAKAKTTGFYAGGRRREGAVFELLDGDGCPAWAEPVAAPLPAEPGRRKKAEPAPEK